MAFFAVVFTPSLDLGPVPITWQVLSKTRGHIPLTGRRLTFADSSFAEAGGGVPLKSDAEGEVVISPTPPGGLLLATPITWLDQRGSA